MSIELIKSILVTEPLPVRISDYKVENWQSGPGGTVLDMVMRISHQTRFGKFKAEMVGLHPEVEGENAEAAIDKLADWMERMAKELRSRGKPQIAVASYPGKKT